MERQRPIVARSQVDLERELGCPGTTLGGQPLDIGVDRPPDAASLELGPDRHPVEVHEVVVTVTEPQVVDRVVGRAGGEHETEADDRAVDFGDEGDRGFGGDRGQVLDRFRADGGHLGFVDVMDRLEIIGPVLPQQHARTLPIELAGR